MLFGIIKAYFKPLFSVSCYFSIVHQPYRC
jgi:hypothetical protein